MTLALYAPSLSNGYVYEDARAPQAWSGLRVWVSGAVQRPHRSLTTLVWHLTGEVTAYRPSAQRAVSLALHWMNAVLLWCLARRLRLAPLGVAVAVGLFLLHPLQTEAVVMLAYRSELLIGMSVLVALLCVERGWWVSAWLAAGGAVLAKESGLVAFALVPLWAVWRGSRVPWWWLLAVVPAVVVMRWLGTFGLLWATPADMAATLGAWGWLMLSWGLLVPESIDPDWGLRLTALVLVGLFLAWGALLVAAWRCRGWWALVAAWSLVIVAPRVPWQFGEGLHGHHVYLASLVLSLSAGHALSRKGLYA